MEPIKININGPKNGVRRLNIIDMIETDDELLIKLDGKECYLINEGQTLTFTRTFHSNSGAFEIITDNVKVLYEDEDHVIHTTKVHNRMESVYNTFDYVNYTDSWEEDDNGEEVCYTYLGIRTKKNHNIFPQDLLHGMEEVYIKDTNGNVLLTFSGDGIIVPNNGIGWDSIATSGDCLTLISEDRTCNKAYGIIKTYQYDFLNNNIMRDGLILKCPKINVLNIVDIINNMSIIETKFNPFYFYYVLKDDNGNPKELDKYGKPIKHCQFYADQWFEHCQFINKCKIGEKYVGETYEIFLTLNNRYWDCDIALSTNADTKHLGSDDNFNEKFIKEVEESLIPDVIDMERIKYAPMVCGNNNNERYYKWVSKNDGVYGSIYTNEWITSANTDENGTKIVENVFAYNGNTLCKIDDTFVYDAFVGDYGSIYREEYDNISNELIIYNYAPTGEIVDDSLTIATSITFNLHFRKRQEIDTSSPTAELKSRKQNTPSTYGNVYVDGWFINEDEAETTWWNGMNYSGSVITSGDMQTFINASGTTSDLMGYLNFVDGDIFYRKKKVSESFIRLTFYNSPNILEQKILFYSTIFFDTNVLYGKYVKQLMHLTSNGMLKNAKNSNAAIVFSNDNTVSARIDTKIVVTNECDRTKSSEGFNLYLFAQDRNIGLENGEKTIYMKVEFNHAGNGKTLPMIMWPKDENGNFVSLTTHNFIQSLYIPIKLSYINGKYIYYVPDAFKNENGNIEFVLFEPKLDIIEMDGFEGEIPDFDEEQ